MMGTRGLLVCAALAASLVSGAAETVRVLGLDAARPYERGFTRDGDEIVVDNGDDAARRAGAVWSLALNQTEARPFTVRTEARCERGPGGTRTRAFSLYVDLVYMDGDHLWGQTADFAPDPQRGWRAGTVTVIPAKPVRSASVYCLYRGLPGRVRFRAPAVRIREQADLALFDAQPVALGDLPRHEAGFLVRDVQRADDGYAPIPVGGEAKGVRLSVVETPAADGATYRVTVEDRTGRDRALTLVYAWPLPAGDLVFEEDPRTAVPLADNAPQRSDAQAMGCGAGGLNRWPFGAVSVGGRGFALGIDTAHPAYFRTAVHPRTRLLFIAFDLGLAPEKRTAAFAFRRFTFTGGFRGALAAYAAREPDAFKTRVPEQGIWMPFRAIKSVENWQDFGFKFKEGNDETAWDDAHGIFTFRYTEPTTWWLSMDKAHGTNRFTMADCLAKVESLAAKGDPRARAWRGSVMRDEDGARVGRVMDTPWCRGAIWLLSPLPDIAGICEYKVKNTEADFAKFYAKPFPVGQDGDTYLGYRIESRDIDIVGYIKERDKQAAQNLRRKLNRILNPQYEATLTYVFGDFRRVIGCKIDDAPIFKRKPIFEQFTVSLSCLNPFWREETETREDIATWIGGFEFPVPDGLELYDGWEIGYRQPSLIVNVYNSGDVKSGIRIEFRAIGAVTNPVLLNVDTREFIKLNISLVAGDVLTVSTGYGEKAVKLNRGGTITDAFRYLDVDSSYLQIAVGDNLFRYSADANAENLEVSIYHNNLYLGV